MLNSCFSYDLIRQLFLKKNIFLFLFLLMYCDIVNAQNHKPNIILILADDIGYQTPQVNGGKSYTTPNLNAMAAEGMNFTECHASPTCSPSRFMLLTGKYNFRNYTKRAVMDQGQRTIANMLKDAGYVTACYGKWQLDGGAASVDTFGFDKYCLFNVSGQTPENKGARYKNPYLFTNGKYIPDSLTANKYSEDILGDSISNFIDSNKDRPFFIYYSMLLAHSHFQPTPEDSAYATWNSATKSDTAYYPSMIKYMDEKIGLIMDKVKSLGIEQNTVILYTGDNGTPAEIYQYVDDDSLIEGGKGNTTEQGTHVPLLVWWPGTITPGSINNDLIGFTDFLPTLAGIAKIPVPNTFGQLDGVSFYPRLNNRPGTPRESLFYHYDVHPEKLNPKRWAQTTTYKLYDTSHTKDRRLFYNIIIDPQEKFPIPDNKLTPQEAQIKQELLDVINGYVAQALPIFSKPFLSNITDTSVILNDTILYNGGSTILTSGVVWSGSPDPLVYSSPHITIGKELGSITSPIKGLEPNKTYYARVYAVNAYDTTYGNTVEFHTLLPTPVSISATGVDSNNFTANWRSIPNVSNYGLDVSLYPNFSTNIIKHLSEGFNRGMKPPDGWTFSSNIIVNDTTFGKQSPSIQFNASKTQIITERLAGPASKLSFWMKQSNIDKNSSLLVEGFDGHNWSVIEQFKNLPSKGTLEKFGYSIKKPLKPVFIQFRFTYAKSECTLAFDDVNIIYTKTIRSLISGYDNLSVTGTSAEIKGLNAGTNYYYRVRATTNNDSSGNSNSINVKTCKAATITSIDEINTTCNGSNDGSIKVDASGRGLTFNWNGPDDYMSQNKNISNLSPGKYEVKIASNGGCLVDSTVTVIEPPVIKVDVSSEPIGCVGGTTNLKISATGGNGGYMYSLSCGDHILGPQSIDSFRIKAGNYKVTVKDKNNCSFVTNTVHVKDGEDNCSTMLIKISPNPTNNEFALTVETVDDAPIQLIVTDLYGSKIYQTKGSNNRKYVFGNEFTSGVYFAQVIQANTKKTIRLIKINK